MKSRQNTYRILGRDKSRLTFVVQRFRSGGFDGTETARDSAGYRGFVWSPGVTLPKSQDDDG